MTGANSGIGKATTMLLARMGATTILACRNLTKARQAKEQIRSGSDAVSVVELDLGDLRSVVTCAGEVIAATGGVDVLINNAGATFPSRILTPQGFEQTFAANYLGHYGLTRLLLNHLRREPCARVISVTSDGHKFVSGIRWDDLTFEGRYSTMAAYTNAKLAQILFPRELANAIGLGLPARVLDLIVQVFANSPEQGAATMIHLASTDASVQSNGGYWARRKPASPSQAATDDASAKRLWDLSDRLVTNVDVALPPI